MCMMRGSEILIEKKVESEMIAAGIVLYNPEWERLKENIEAIIPQVGLLVLVDNGSDNLEMVKKYCQDNLDIVLIRNDKNLGIAKALNQIIKYCYDKQCEWVLTLDQDSVSPAGMIDKFRAYTKEKKVGIICPTIKDRNDQYGKAVNKKIEYIEQCITSGALINICVWHQIKGYDENMFIDMVDFEYCARVRLAGYSIVRVNTVFLLHECGNLKVIKIGKRLVQITNHSSFRCYYYAKNIVYCHKKIPEVFTTKWMNKFLLEKVIKILFFEKEKVPKIMKVIKGIYDGMQLQIKE